MIMKKPPFDRTPKNNMEAMMLLIWLMRNAPSDEIKEMILDEIEKHGKLCSEKEIEQAMLNMGEWNYFAGGINE
mgnify:CR=1 FL=1